MKRTPQMFRMGVALLFVMMLAVAGCTAAKQGEAGKPPVPTDMQFHTIVDTAFVQDLVKIPHPENTLIVDSRPAKLFPQGYIPTAVSIPDSQFDKLAANMLPENKNALLVFYCGGLHCPLSHKSAKKAEAMGYTNVKVYAAGFPAWKRAGNAPAIGLEKVADMMAKGEQYMLIDSRPSSKFLEGAIPSSISIPDSQFAKKTGMLPADKNTPLAFYCGGFACPLSHKSAAKAMELGYTDVSIAEAGYPGWKTMFGGGQAVAVKAGADEGSVDIEWFQKTMSENPDAINVIDVRDPAEYEAGHITGSVNIPVDKLEKSIKDLSADKPIVYVCASGARSGEAYYMTKDMRPDIEDVFYLEAETTYHKDGSFEVNKH